jgi:hypothetical protein
MIGRALSWILLVVALLAAGRDGLLFLETGIYNPATLGEIWYAVDGDSLNLTQTLIERYGPLWLWQSAISPLLVWPAWAVLGTGGLIFGIIFGRGGRRRRRSSFG